MRRRLLFLALLALPSLARACPGCNTGVRSGDAAATTRVLAGFSWSVVLLVGAVALALGFLGWAAARAVKEADQARN
ncbi:MAG: hypothetical protein PW734_04810 [Verrucomicrobium sp.]|nr:hypothetical protein [Verrucomicrobium sp.]